MSYARIAAAAGFITVAIGSAVAQDTGVPACDDFYKQYDACVMTKIPESQRATFRQQLDAGKAAIRQAAANPAARPQLEQSCTMQKQQMAQAMKPYGCEFK
ncbi:MAG: hypothetical protein ACRCTI_17340 [Beijerinckiaceae bacterium]